MPVVVIPFTTSGTMSMLTAVLTEFSR